MEVRSRRARESSPERAKVCMQPRVKPIKKVQVVYYLSRNGQLEHPHYMEVSHFANQHLRLKDVMDRLTVLRGKGMPSLYSWSCKRSYKNGYVWNDLAENDIIYPAEGAEYVLKGSELVEGCSERFQQLNVSNKQLIQEPNLNPRTKQAASVQNRERQEAEQARYEYQDYGEDEEEEEEEYEYEEKTSYTSSTTPHSRCSKGVSTDELEEQETIQTNHIPLHHQEPHKNPSESTHHDSSPSTTSSILSEKPGNRSNNTSKRFEDGDPVVTESTPSRNSVLRQLIACGNLAVAKAKNAPTFKQPETNVVKKSENLHKGLLCKSAAVKVNLVEEDMINYMSENPRFGNLQAEEKEYFSGSIVETMSEDRAVAEPGLKRSNSYNEERSSKAGIGDAVEVDEKREKSFKGKCIPRKISSCSKQTRR